MSVDVVRRRRFTVKEYDRMLEVGILAEDKRFELLDGEVVERVPEGTPHAACISRLDRLVGRALGDRAMVRVQHPIVVGQHSEPEPDVAIVRWRDDFYATAHPRPEDVLLLVEVADSSLLLDRNRKLPIYAAHGVADSWLVDLPARRVEIHRDPTPDGYRDVTAHAPGERLAVAGLDDVELAVDAVIP